MWQIDQGVEFAIHHLERQSTIFPPRRLELARRYSIFQWVKPALKLLIFEDFLWVGLTPEECNQISFHVYRIITKARGIVERERWSLALIRPQLRLSTCPNHGGCEKAWKTFWEAKMQLRLLHPADPLPLDEIADHVQKHLNSLELAQMTSHCKEAIVVQLQENRLIESILDSATEAVITYFTSL